MVLKAVLLAFVAVAAVNCYSGGAPEGVCTDMVPKHPAEPQKSRFPYTVSVSKKEIKAGEKIQITVSGKNGKIFKGYLLQVRDGEEAVGTFNIPDTDKYSKTINCHEAKQNAATHKNSAEKKSLTLDWTAPTGKTNVVVYATVAENGAIYWVHQPTATIKVN